jgi:hypothetical protein
MLLSLLPISNFLSTHVTLFFFAAIIPQDCMDCPHKMNFLPLSFFLSEVSFML